MWSRFKAELQEAGQQAAELERQVAALERQVAALQHTPTRASVAVACERGASGGEGSPSSMPAGFAATQSQAARGRDGDGGGANGANGTGACGSVAEDGAVVEAAASSAAEAMRALVRVAEAYEKECVQRKAQQAGSSGAATAAAVEPPPTTFASPLLLPLRTRPATGDDAEQADHTPRATDQTPRGGGAPEIHQVTPTPLAKRAAQLLVGAAASESPHSFSGVDSEAVTEQQLLSERLMLYEATLSRLTAAVEAGDTERELLLEQNLQLAERMAEMQAVVAYKVGRCMHKHGT